MLLVILRRLAAAVPTLALVFLAAFSLLYLVPGDPAVEIAGANATLDDIAATRTRLGLDDPFLTRLWDFLTGAFRGDLGTSLFTGDGVVHAISTRLPVTLSVAVFAIVLTVLIGLPIGLISGLRPNSLIDRFLTFVTTSGVSVPDFWIGLMLVLLLSLKLGLLPAVGYIPFAENPGQWFLHLILPASTLSITAIAEFSRQLRASVIEVSRAEYVRTARSKGFTETRISLKHILKNALTAPVTVLGVQAAHMLGGAVVIEFVFGLPGVGNFAVESVLRQDFPVVQGIVLLSGVIVVAINLVVDIAQGYLNPRLRAVR